MTPDQAARLKSFAVVALGFVSDRAYWDNEAKPPLIGTDPTRAGAVELSIVRMGGIGAIGDEARETYDGNTRTRTHHKMRECTIQLDCLSMTPQLSAVSMAERLKSAFQDEAPEAANEAAGISLVELGEVRPLNFKADGGKFDRAVLDVRLYLSWEEVDTTATPDTIGSASVGIVPT